MSPVRGGVSGALKPCSVYAPCAPAATSMRIGSFHERQEYERNHAVHYADHHVPATTPPTRSTPHRNRDTLKIVKSKK
jgi:hypothetical protein